MRTARVASRRSSEEDRAVVPSMLLATLALVAIGAAAWLATRGFDRTDEGFYLNSIAHPNDDRSTILLFGYAYHPLYVLVAGDVVLLRWVGMLMSVVAVGLLAWVSMKTPALVGDDVPNVSVRIAVAVGLGATALLTISQMPLSPSYNSLALQGVAFASTCLILTVTHPGRSGSFGPVGLGVGLWLTFMGKPTTAALLAVLVVGVTVVVPGAWRRRLWTVIVSLLLACTVTLVTAGMSPFELVDVMSRGLATSIALGGHDQIIRLDPFPPRGAGFRIVGALAAVTASIVLLMTHRARSTKPVNSWWFRTLGAASVLCTFALTAGLAWRAASNNGVRAVVTSSDTTATLFVLSGCAIAVTWLASAQRLQSSWHDGLGSRPAPGVARSRRALLSVLMLLPPAYAIGTNTNLWTATGRATCFWLLVLCLVMLRSHSSLRRFGLWATGPLVGSLIIVNLLLASTANAPYRYAPLQLASATTVVGDGQVDLTPEDHAMVADLHAAGGQLHITGKTRILDLTGDSPGSIFLLGARPAAQAWVIGGYPGSEAAARLAIASDRCSVMDALLLVAEGTPRSISPDVLSEMGRTLADYRAVGRFTRERSGSSRIVDAINIYAPRFPTDGRNCR